MTYPWFYFDLAFAALFGLTFYGVAVVFMLSFQRARLRRWGFATSEAVFAGILVYPPTLAFLYAVMFATVG